MTERLQKLMAQAGLGSRRNCEALISAGRVRVNGRVARLGEKADPAQDEITVDGSPIRFEQKLYLMLNKPKGVLSSTEDELGEGRVTVRDLVDVQGHLYPVGRLDKQSEGLVLLTNDGELAHRLTHPRYEHEKVYEVLVEGKPSESVLAQWAVGLMLDGRRTAPADLRVLEQGEGNTRLLITMREGRKRQIRRIAAMLGHPAQSLVRRQIGPLHLGDLPSGQWRHLTVREVALLRKAASRRSKMRPAPSKEIGQE